MSSDVYTLPPDLPVPEGDGACDHLPGLELPDLVLESYPVFPPDRNHEEVLAWLGS